MKELLNTYELLSRLWPTLSVMALTLFGMIGLLVAYSPRTDKKVPVKPKPPIPDFNKLPYPKIVVHMTEKELRIKNSAVRYRHYIVAYLKTVEMPRFKSMREALDKIDDVASGMNKNHNAQFGVDKPYENVTREILKDLIRQKIIPREVVKSWT